MLDWWVLGGAAELDAFGAMVEGFSALTDEMRRDILVRGGSCMGHTYYGLQLRRMNATLRFVGNTPVDFTLGRMWQREALIFLILNFSSFGTVNLRHI